MILQASALSTLRAATRDAHLNLEKNLIVTLPNAGRAEYLAYVAALWGWLTPFEAELWNAPWPEHMLAHERAGKRRWIEHDLRAADFSDAAIDALPVSSFSPDMESMAARFGLAYVIEGAQLGGQVLRKALAPALGSWSPRWLQGYGAQTSAKWKVFTECAERDLTTDAARQTAAAAAAQAFDALASWLETRRVA